MLDYPSDGETRAHSFLRGLLPEELNTLLLLGGFFFLYIAPSLGWWPEGLNRVHDLMANPTRTELYRELADTQFVLIILYLLALPIRLAGAMTLLACFLRPKRILRFLICWVYLPVGLSLFAMVAFLVSASEPHRSILEPQWVFQTALLRQIFGNIHGYGLGEEFTLVGLALVTLFVLFPASNESNFAEFFSSSFRYLFRGDRAEEQPKSQTARFVWIAIVAPICCGPISSAAAGLTSLIEHFSNSFRFWYVQFGYEAGFGFAFVCIVVWAMGRTRRQELRRFLSLPCPLDLLIAILLPLMLANILSLAAYLPVRVHWAAFDYGKLNPPSLLAFVIFPGWSLLRLLIPAFAEEFAWRGYLQPRLIQDYGVAKGIFFTAMAWSAFHFTFDFRQSMTTWGVLLSLGSRLATCLALSVPIGWITLRTGSILPAGIIHTLYNSILVPLHGAPLLPWSTDALFFIAGMLLFRFWRPVQLQSFVASHLPGEIAPAEPVG